MLWRPTNAGATTTLCVKATLSFNWRWQSLGERCITSVVEKILTPNLTYASYYAFLERKVNAGCGLCLYYPVTISVFVLPCDDIRVCTTLRRYPCLYYPVTISVFVLPCDDIRVCTTLWRYPCLYYPVSISVFVLPCDDIRVCTTLWRYPCLFYPVTISVFHFPSYATRTFWIGVLL
jgi:hypothetical protein